MDPHTTAEIQSSVFVFSELLNRDFLNTNYDKNLELAKNIFQSFLENSAIEMDELKAEVIENNHEKIAFIAHKIKNNFVYIGAESLKEQLSELEFAAKEKSNDSRKIFAKLYIEYEDFLPILKEEYRRIKEHLNN